MATEEEFKRLIRIMHQYIKAHHHLLNVQISTGNTEEPPSMVRTMRWLETVIKPATPTDRTETLLYGNARNWLHTTLHILEEHYLQKIGELASDIKSYNCSRWREAWQVAIRWARRNLKKIQTSTIQWATAEITQLLEPSASPENNAELRSVPDPAPNQSTKYQLTTPDPRPSNTEQEHAGHSNREEQRLHSPILGPTGTIQKSEDLENRESQTFTNQVPGARSTPRESTGPNAITEKEQTRMKQRNTENPETLEAPAAIPGHSQHQPRTWAQVVRNTKLTPKLTHSTSTSPIPSNTQEAQMPQDRPNTQETEPSPISANKETSRFTCHPHYGDKYGNWHLEPTRPFLILGDSNLSRLPRIQDNRVQVDSYPGAMLAHANHIIKHKTQTSPDTQKVILSFGINNRSQSNPTLLKKQLSRLLGTAESTFPNAVIYIPLINYDNQLPSTTKDNLLLLNKLIKITGRSIPAIPRKDFATTQDGIHWTPETAEIFCNHWLLHLN
ncbi:hypothetical protein AMEX_G25721 [Astyanax mexicanus]|uniref:Uncharacterized protein n=1 Tax=Astyanax mexicanus TaxID=7994 RepID=A0A8T2KQD5_ASTMX|nr:hypothetical protein AMEX_G25721 [Astyanax mexicanus]